MSEIASLHRAACQLWEAYLEQGPGKLSAEALEPFLSQQALVPAEAEAVHKVLGELEPLLRRCVERTEGLCFVTGEAGLIPRRDLHEKCEDLLAKLACM